MAFFSQGGGGPITPGAQSLQQRYGAPSGVTPPTQEPMDEWDRWELHFAPAQIAPPTTGSERAGQFYESQIARAATAQTADRRRLMEYAKRIGVDTSNPGNLGKLWLDAVSEARGASFVNPTTPWQILDAWAKNPKGYSGAAGVSRGPRTITQTNRNVNITNPRTARAIAKQALRAELQRDPSKEEYASFVAGLTGAERASPSVSTTTAKYDAEGNQVSSDTTTEGGVDAQAFADEWMQRHDSEADAVRAGQDYFSAAMQLVRPVV